MVAGSRGGLRVLAVRAPYFISASTVSPSRSVRGYFRILVAISRNTKADVMQITWRDPPPLYSGVPRRCLTDHLSLRDSSQRLGLLLRRTSNDEKRGAHLQCVEPPLGWPVYENADGGAQRSRL